MNRIITRGLGTTRGAAGRAGLVTSGYGGIFTSIAEFARRIRYGKSGDRRDYYDKIVVWAGLKTVNDEKPNEKINGTDSATIPGPEIKVKSSLVHAGAAYAFEKIKIIVRRLKDNLKT